jgi:hypothetical protein
MVFQMTDTVTKALYTALTLNNNRSADFAGTISTPGTVSAANFSGTGTSPIYRVDSGLYLGIGSSEANTVTIYNGSTGAAGIAALCSVDGFRQRRISNSVAPIIALQRARGTSVPASVQDTDVLGDFAAYGYETSGADAYYLCGYARFLVDGAITTPTKIPTKFELHLLKDDGTDETALSIANVNYSEIGFRLVGAFPGGTPPGMDTFKDGTKQYAFDKNTEESLHGSIEYPHDGALNGSFYIHIHWSPKTAGDGAKKVCWGFEYTRARIDTAQEFGATNTSYGNGADAIASTSAFRHQMTSIVTLTGCYPGEIITYRIFRDATSGGGTDDYADDAFGLEVGAHYKIVATGTKGFDAAGHASR